MSRVSEPRPYILLGVFPPRVWDDAREYVVNYPVINNEDDYVRFLDAVLGELSATYENVLVHLLDLDDYLEWCAEEGHDPHWAESRAAYVQAQSDDDWYEYTGSVRRIFEADDALVRVLRAHAHAGGTRSGFSDDLVAAGTALLADVASALDEKGAHGDVLLSVELPASAQEQALGLHFLVEARDGALFATSDLEYECLMALLYCGLLEGGALWVRGINGTTSFLCGYEFGDRRYRRGTPSEVQQWRAGRDALVGAVGGSIEVC